MTNSLAASSRSGEKTASNRFRWLTRGIISPGLIASLICLLMAIAGPVSGQSFEIENQPLGPNNGLRDGGLDLGDVKGDGDLDLVVTGEDNDGNSRLLVLQNNGEGFFGSKLEPLGTDSGLQSGDASFDDADGDDVLDFAAMGKNSADTHRLLVYENTASTSASVNFNILDEPLNGDSGLIKSSMAWGNFNGDTSPDLVVAGEEPDGDRRLFVLANNGNGSFSTLTNPMQAQGLGMGVADGDLAVADIDGDGDDDIAVIGEDGSAQNRFIIFENDGSGTFPSNQEAMGSNKGVKDGGIAWGDFDGDGDPDLALTGTDNVANDRFILFENRNGQLQKFDEPEDENKGFKQSDVAWSDFNSNGHQGLAVMGRDSANELTLLTYKNNGNGLLSRHVHAIDPDTGLERGALGWGDVNGDDKPDLVAMGSDNNNRFRLVVLINQGRSSSDDDDDLECLIGRTTSNPDILNPIRKYRDHVMKSRVGRLITTWYYQISSTLL